MQSLDTRTIVNHIALVIDESSSMKPHSRTVVGVVDKLIEHLGQTSRDMDQETRISVYAFNSRGTDRCLVFDTDVLRIPSIAGKYRPDGLTALIDCTCLAIDELKTTSVIHGEHSFVVFSITDGQENNSRKPERLRGLVAGLPDEWTVIAYVPDDSGRRRAEQFGWHPGNIQQWDTAASFENVGKSLRETADLFMAGRSAGVRGYRSGGLFRMEKTTVADIKRALTPLTRGSYQILQNQSGSKIAINTFVELAGKQSYYAGCAYYEMEQATVVIQGTKRIALQPNGSDDVYTGPEARQMLGLPPHEVKVRPSDHPGYTIFVQSTSHNRAILPGQKVLVLR